MGCNNKTTERSNMNRYVWILLQESNVDGEVITNAVPFATESKAIKAFEDTKKAILTEYHHYKQFNKEELEEYFTIEDSENGYFIEDNSDDYYELVRIEKKKVL